MQELNERKGSFSDNNFNKNYLDNGENEPNSIVSKIQMIQKEIQENQTNNQSKQINLVNQYYQNNQANIAHQSNEYEDNNDMSEDEISINNGEMQSNYNGMVNNGNLSDDKYKIFDNIQNCMNTILESLNKRTIKYEDFRRMKQDGEEEDEDEDDLYYYKKPLDNNHITTNQKITTTTTNTIYTQGIITKNHDINIANHENIDSQDYLQYQANIINNLDINKNTDKDIQIISNIEDLKLKQEMQEFELNKKKEEYKLKKEIEQFELNKKREEFLLIQKMKEYELLKQRGEFEAQKLKEEIELLFLFI